MRKELTINNLFDTTKTIAKKLIDSYQYPWEILPNINEFIISIGKNLPQDEYELVAENVWKAKTAKVAPTAFIGSPSIICAHAEIRHGAFIRENAIVGEKAVVGNSTELKNVILFDHAQVPHYNYVGDSILGYKAHMGAGAITSNVKSDKSLVSINYNGEKINTNLKKFGAILGDNVEIGCNSVLNPGSIIGRNSSVYPLSSVRGFIAENKIFKNQTNIVDKKL